MKKRLLAAALCMALLMGSLAGCGGDGKQEGSTAPSNTDSTASQTQEPGERVKITLASFPDQPKDALMAAIENANLDFDVEIIEYPQNEYEKKSKWRSVPRPRPT